MSPLRSARIALTLAGMEAADRASLLIANYARMLRARKPQVVITLSVFAPDGHEAVQLFQSGPQGEGMPWE